MKGMNEKWLYKDLTQEIIGVEMGVHREFGSGFLDYVYELLNFDEKSLEIKRKSCEDLCNLVVIKGAKL